MKKYLLIIIGLLFIYLTGCFDDDTNSNAGSGPGSLQVTVSTGNKITGYPVVGHAYDGDDTGTFLYPAVGGDDADDLIEAEDIGNKKFYVYLFTDMQNTAKDLLILYQGEADVAPDSSEGVVTIPNIAADDYYVVAFYDYASGGKQDNLLNRYDRYAFYMNDEEGDDGNPYCTPFYDNASLLTISEGQTSISIKAKKDWVLGKPGSGQGRVFLQAGDEIPEAIPTTK